MASPLQTSQFCYVYIFCWKIVYIELKCWFSTTFVAFWLVASLRVVNVSCFSWPFTLTLEWFGLFVCLFLNHKLTKDLHCVPFWSLFPVDKIFTNGALNYFWTLLSHFDYFSHSTKTTGAQMTFKCIDFIITDHGYKLRIGGSPLHSCDYGAIPLFGFSKAVS